MLRVVETFSGIGSQTMALKNIKIEHQVVATVEWDINAILAYDIIHNGKQDIKEYKSLTKSDLIKLLMEYTLSSDGKKQLTERSLKVITTDGLRKILAAIRRTKNLVNITDVSARDLNDNIDLLTYSFPCQDLSVCGSWHGNNSGIDRYANNRSSMLWEIERILMEFVDIGKKLPKFLLMENVSNILSNTHRANFKEWEDYLESIGYINQIYTLDATNFGIPQNRKRTFMLSVYSKDNIKKNKIKKYFLENNLQNHKKIPLKPLKQFLRTDYNKLEYKNEAESSNPNFTLSRQKIERDNPYIFDGEKVIRVTVNTITTKQDRNPNSGIISYKSSEEKKSPYRNLTPRECFLLMGFKEKDFQLLMDYNFAANKRREFFSREKLIKMAGNSIVINVLEAIFKQMQYINENIL